MWLKLSKDFFGIEKDIFMCMAYIPPESSPYYKARNIDTLSLIEDKIINLDQNSSIVIVGDLNAKNWYQVRLYSQ